eukprot:165372-Rhodomonas_salina.2
MDYWMDLGRYVLLSSYRSRVLKERITLSAYARALRLPVLASRVVLPAYDTPTRCPVLTQGMVLPAVKATGLRLYRGFQGHGHKPGTVPVRVAI